MVIFFGVGSGGGGIASSGDHWIVTGRYWMLKWQESKIVFILTKIITQKNLYLESFPIMCLAEAPLHLTSCTQQRSMFLLVMVSTISLDLPLMVPMFQEAILNVSCGVSHDVDLTGPLPVLPLMCRHLQHSFPVPFLRNLLRTFIVFKMKQDFTTGCPS